VVTSLLRFLPVWHAITRQALREGLVSRRGAALSSAAAGAIHAAAVADQVFFVLRRSPRLRRRGWRSRLRTMNPL
jgi:hypothetical protein